MKSGKTYPKEYAPSDVSTQDITVRNNLLNAILTSKPKKIIQDTNLFKVMAARRSTRKFDNKRMVEEWKIDKILAAADTAPTAGNFQGFEIFYVKDPKIKEKLVEAANNQPHANTPLVLVFCKNPSRVKLDLPPEILAKFAIHHTRLV
ncbi:MAG: nitroreductase [Candidatus Nitrosotenuis sp.]|nr:nitroreductase [Candidatus Nitrosotenuis sp.]